MSQGVPVYAELDRDAYWSKADNFQAWSFAEDFVDVYRQAGFDFATPMDGETIYYHDGYTWHREGEKQVRKSARHVLQNNASREVINEVVRNVRTLTYRDRAEIFDLAPEWIVVDNGKVNLITGEFVRGLDLPGTRTKIDVEYDPMAIPERFNDFLFDVLPRQDVSIMWEVIGYCLYRGYPFQRAVMLYGEGANGKSTLLAALRDLLGEENIAAKELQALTDNRFATADLVGRLANIAPDIADKELESTSTLKALTGGDLLTAERKYEDPFEFENTATLIFSANRPPDTQSDETYAYRRRWLYFHFPESFEGDDAVPQRELLEAFRQEQPAILAQAVEAFQDLWERGGFELTTYMVDNDNAHDRATNPVIEFAEDEVTAVDDGYVRVKAAYEAYRDWANEHGHAVQGRQSKFEPAVRAMHDVAVDTDPRNENYKIWRGVNLADPDRRPDANQDTL